MVVQKPRAGNISWKDENKSIKMMLLVMAVVVMVMGAVSAINPILCACLNSTINISSFNFYKRLRERKLLCLFLFHELTKAHGAGVVHLNFALELKLEFT